MNLQALRAIGAGITSRPRVAPDPALQDFRARFCPEYARALDALEGVSSPYGAIGAASRTVRLSVGHGAESAPFCGDCGAIRRPSGPCAACGSNQPANLSRMNPRARGMIE
jgi:hypothetical protein